MKKALHNQHFWNIVFLFLSVLVFYVFVRYFRPDAPEALARMTAFQFVVLALAAFRLTRLFVSDHITQWLRDIFFIITEETNSETGVMVLVRRKHAQGFRRIMADLLECSWCMGIWMAFFVIILYVAVVLDVFAVGRVILYIFALAGTASLLQALTRFFMAERATDSLPKLSSARSWNGEEKRKSPPNVCTECGLG